ncbi:OmpA family protein [Pseudomonas sp. GX19020]|uniref:OmpA family protein n=1 Tax=Pseudomonas sp. GX19020 TaxID=2942277 RepID=UPI0020190808|nr:OmpA family protein [Pseudomonas sp. GX19020]MCL4065195.1 OmpA family protein [Pseudomonas sp. GX19020]
MKTRSILYVARALTSCLFASHLMTTTAGAQELPQLLDFFSIATPTEKTPQIDNYDETWMITGPVSDSLTKATEGENWKLLEGRIIYAYYRFAPGDSALQITRSFEAAAKDADYDVVFSCNSERGDCFTSGDKVPGLYVGLLLDKPNNMPALDALDMQIVRNLFQTGGARLLYLTKGTGENVIHMQVALADTPEKGVMAITKTVITGDEPGLTGATSMRDKLVAGENVTLDNLLFDTDSAILLPPSREQVFEIAMMLRDDPALKLEIIGHTDSDGGRPHNQGLSERRAAAVVDALVNGFDIEAERLTSSGRGMDEPVASNATSAGKAKNRRVELRLR